MDENITNVLELANTHSNEGRYEIAIDLLKETLRTYPNNLNVRTTLGIVLAKANRDRESEKMLRSVIEKDQYHEEATSGLGRLLDNSLRTQESEKLYREFLKAKPESYLVLTDLARMLFEEGRVDEAFTIAKNQIEENPKELRAYTLLRQLLLLEEIMLEDNMIDSDSKNYKLLISNLVEQYDLIKRIEQLFDTSEVEPDLIRDELPRLLGRFEELQSNLHRIVGQISKSVLNQMNQTMKEISKSLMKQ